MVPMRVSNIMLCAAWAVEGKAQSSCPVIKIILNIRCALTVGEAISDFGKEKK